MISARLVIRVAVPVILVGTAATAVALRRTAEHDARPGSAPHSMQTATPPSPLAPTTTPAAIPTPSTTSPPTRTSTSSPTSKPARKPTRSPAGPRTSASPTTTPGDTAQSASLDGLLQPDNPVPDGVPAQLNLFLGGGQVCSEEEFPDAHVEVPAEPVVIPSVPIVCLHGFDRSHPVKVIFTAPDGTTRTVTVPAYSRHYDGVYFHVPPGSPAGRYRVRAIQGPTSATGEFPVVRAVRPHVWTHPKTAYAGDTVDVYLGGFPPRRSTDLHLYACLPLAYRATQKVAIDARGEAYLTLRTTSTTERTCYALNSPLVYVPADPPETVGGPDHQVFWVHDPVTAEPPACAPAALRC